VRSIRLGPKERQGGAFAGSKLHVRGSGDRITGIHHRHERPRPRCGYRPKPGDRRWGSRPANPDQVQIDDDFAACDFSGPKMAENLYGFRDRICGFSKECGVFGRNGSRFFVFDAFACVVRADAAPFWLNDLQKIP